MIGLFCHIDRSLFPFLVGLFWVLQGFPGARWVGCRRQVVSVSLSLSLSLCLSVCLSRELRDATIWRPFMRKKDTYSWEKEAYLWGKEAYLWEKEAYLWVKEAYSWEKEAYLWGKEAYLWGKDAYLWEKEAKLYASFPRPLCVMCSLTIECVVFSYYRMCSLTIECVLLPSSWGCTSLRKSCSLTIECVLLL